VSIVEFVYDGEWRSLYIMQSQLRLRRDHALLYQNLLIALKVTRS